MDWAGVRLRIRIDLDLNKGLGLGSRLWEEVVLRIRHKAGFWRKG